MTLRKTHVHTIFGPIPIIDGFGNATIVLPKGTILHIENAFLISILKRNLLSFKMYAVMGTMLRLFMSKIKNILALPLIRWA